MDAICIETENTNPETFRRRLLQQVESWQSNGLVQEFNETSKGKITIWDCKTVNYQAKNLRHLAAQVIADYIVSEVEPTILKKLAILHHPHFNTNEVDLVSDKVTQRLAREESLTGACRREKIESRIEEYLLSQEQINIEGFLRFRLQDYQRELLVLINQSADDYMIEKEYEDFINLLKYFVEVQQPRFPEMHLLFEKDVVILSDPQYNVIHQERVNSLEGSDAIISTLVTAAPSKLTIHGPVNEKDELISTIHNIFNSRVCVCLGCEHCLEE